MTSTLVPALIKPRLFTLKNRWKSGRQQRLKEIIGLSFSLLMMLGVYSLTQTSLRDIARLAPEFKLNPTPALSMMLSALFVMITLSAAVNGVGALFLSKDLDLTLSAPITPRAFLIGKTLDVGLSVSWMVCIFSLPALLAIGSIYSNTPIFFAVAPALCAIFFSIAIVIGMVIAIMFASIIPSERGKPILIALFLVSLGVFIGMLNGFSPGSAATHQLQINLMNQTFSITSNAWMPSTHLATALNALMYEAYLAPILTALGGTLIFTALFFTLQFTHALLYERGLERTRAHRGLLRLSIRRSLGLRYLVAPLSSSVKRAIILKEYKIFSRDLTHAVQLMLLLGVTFVYLHNYQALQGYQTMSEQASNVLATFLLLSNLALGSLVIASICSRFVFPAVSMEGAAFWIIQSSPLSMRDLLNAKFRAWLVPISLIGGVIFISGAMALNAAPALVIASCVAGVIVCHGLVALAIGLGALFSQFDWEHSTQLSTSFGSFIFMITSMAFLALSMFPVCLSFAIYLLAPDVLETIEIEALLLGSGLAFAYVINRITAWWALSAGARALASRK